ncbi:glycosyltransferase [bacterium]|nr:glycosyltransferase [bacterium]NBX83387.1 glycosyltransferase [bacterium]
MKVLILTHHRIQNNFNGAVTRIRNLAEQLAVQGAQVTVYSLISPRNSPLPASHFATGWSLYESNNLIQWADGLGGFLGLPPYSLTAYLNAFLPLPAWAKDSFDVMITESPFLWQVAQKVKAKIRVLSAHNHETTYHDDFSPIALWLLKRNETKALRQADLIISLAHEDKLIFQTISPKTPIQIIPNGFLRMSSTDFRPSHTQDIFRSRWAISKTHRLALFLASESTHNQRAFTSLIELFSRSAIQQRWCLLVVGNIQIKKSVPPSIIACGVQKSLLDVIEICEVALNPVTSGSGSNVKLIECLGNGLPVLSTPFGARGYDRNLSGLHIEPLEKFETRLLEQTPWINPKPEELVTYEWAVLGRRLFEVFQSALKKQAHFS